MSEEPENKSGHGGFWFGMILGGLIGAVLAVFATADDKDELKKNLLKKGKIFLKHLGDIREEVEEKGEDVKEGVVEKLSEVKEAADKTETRIHQKARKFFLSKGRPLVKK